MQGIKLRSASAILVGLALCWAAGCGADPEPQTEQAPAVTVSESQPLIYSVKGADLFLAYCASCHGPDGKGGGPAAAALKTMVPDLTILARNNQGQFPSAHVRSTIVGEEVRIAHGSREMPIWGPIFHQIESDQDFGNVRVENLTRYLESIQVK